MSLPDQVDPDPTDATGTPDFALLRVAALSVSSSARMVDQADVTDPWARAAIATAAGTEVLDSAAHKERAEETVIRYLARMGGRATPYGLFAGTAVTGIGAERRLRLDEREQHRVRTRVDIAALEGVLAEALEQVPITRWPLRVNRMARVEDEVIRFSRAGDATADVVTIKVTAFIARLLGLIGDREVSGGEIVDGLIAWRSELTSDQIVPVLAQLLDAGLLERAATLIVPGLEPLDRAIQLLDDIGATETANALRALGRDCCGLGPVSENRQADGDRAWDQAAATLPTLAAVAPGHRFDSQLELSAPQAQLDRDTVDDLTAAVLRIQRISAAAGPADGPRDGLDLERLRTAFRARYEDAEVPLLSAVDLESGVLQPAGRQLSRLAVEAGISSDHSQTGVRIADGVLSAYRRFAWSEGPVDIADFEPAETLGSRAVAAVLLDHYEGRYTSLLVGGLGRSPFALMARFALGRPDLGAAFERQLRREAALAPGPGEAADPIRAELVYHPGGRIGNVLIRPRLLADSIALTGAAGGTIGLDRLTLRLVRDQFQLRDLDSGRPVVLEMNTAHNIDFHGLDPIYPVLGRLAGGEGAGWSWGGLSRLDHLPRVTCGTVIVAAEQWQLTAAQIETVRADADPAGRLRDELHLSADQRRWLGVGSLDHILPIDLQSGRSVRAALARLDADTATVVEMPQAEAPAVAGPDGGHVAEVVIGLGRALRPAPQPPATDAFYCPASGAQWVYARFHCGQASGEHVIARAAELAQRLHDERLIDDWFFVRYVDEGYHIRVRMRTVGSGRSRVLGEVSALGAQLRSAGIVGRMVIDDYVPEVARYGGRGTLALAERLFTTDSTEIAAFLAVQPDETARLHRAVADTVAWVERIAPTPAARIEFLQGCQGGLQVRFAKSGNRHGKLFRTHRTGLEQALADRGRPDSPVLGALTELVEAVAEAAPDRALPILGSCLHMHANRMFAFDAVRLEYLSHEFAIRKIRELAARRPAAAPIEAGAH